MAEEYIDIDTSTPVSESPAPQVEPEFVHPTKPWYVMILQVVPLHDGTIYGLGSNNKMYNWHHSFKYAGKWVLVVTGK